MADPVGPLLPPALASDALATDARGTTEAKLFGDDVDLVGLGADDRDWYAITMRQDDAASQQGSVGYLSHVATRTGSA